jgi:hypothetical protein
MRTVQLRYVTAVIVVSLAGGVAAQRPAVRSAPPRPAPMGSHPAEHRLTAAESTAVALQYCVTCHSERGKAGGLSLAGFAAATAEASADVAEKMIRKLRVGMMPPPGARRPGRQRLPAWLPPWSSTSTAPLRRIPIPAGVRFSV